MAYVSPDTIFLLLTALCEAYLYMPVVEESLVIYNDSRAAAKR